MRANNADSFFLTWLPLLDIMFYRKMSWRLFVMAEAIAQEKFCYSNSLTSKQDWSLSMKIENMKMSFRSLSLWCDKSKLVLPGHMEAALWRKKKIFNAEILWGCSAASSKRNLDECMWSWKANPLSELNALVAKGHHWDLLTGQLKVNVK